MILRREKVSKNVESKQHKKVAKNVESKQYLEVGFDQTLFKCVNAYYGRYNEVQSKLVKELYPKIPSIEIKKNLQRFATTKSAFVYLPGGVLVRKKDVAYVVVYAEKEEKDV